MGCRRVPKICMCSQLTKILWFWTKKIDAPSLKRDNFGLLPKSDTRFSDFLNHTLNFIKLHPNARLLVRKFSFVYNILWRLWKQNLIDSHLVKTCWVALREIILFSNNNELRNRSDRSDICNHDLARLMQYIHHSRLRIFLKRPSN